MLEPGSFDVCKNVIVPMMAMLDHSELDMEVSDVGIETAESNDYRGLSRVSRDDRDINSVLATI